MNTAGSKVVCTQVVSLEAFTVAVTPPAANKVWVIPVTSVTKSALVAAKASAKSYGVSEVVSDAHRVLRSTDAVFGQLRLEDRSNSTVEKAMKSIGWLTHQ